MACIRSLCGLVDFLTINVSSPNTPGLRDLQGEAFLDDLLARCIEARDEADRGRAKTTILLKIAPDISLDALDAMVATVLKRGVDGLIISNTTIERPDSLKEKALAKETGGLSGKPLFVPSTRLLAETFLRVERRIPLNRRRRRRFRGRCLGEDQSGRQPRSALFGDGLQRTRTCR